MTVYKMPGNFAFLRNTVLSGQSFVWELLQDNAALGLVKGNLALCFWEDNQLAIAQNEDSSLTLQDWREYFGLDSQKWAEAWEYANKLPDFEGKAFTLQAMQNYKEIPILTQTPWEATLSFMLSQNNNIARIRASLAALSKLYGKKQELGVHVRYAVPSPQELENITLDELVQCGTGYRDNYIRRLVTFLNKEPGWLENLRQLDTENLLRQLQTHHGIGRKVATCIALYGYQRYDVFPIDVWIARAIQQHFKGQNPASLFGQHAGVIQQCIYEQMLHG